MTLAKIEDAIAEIQAGRMVIVVDDEDRENEGDIVVAAEKLTADHIGFMVRYCSGIICVPITTSGRNARTRRSSRRASLAQIHFSSGRRTRASRRPPRSPASPDGTCASCPPTPSCA